jgi:hypothetical protein
MNRGIVEQHPERESFVVERFSADLRTWRNGTTTALKRSTTNLRYVSEEIQHGWIIVPYLGIFTTSIFFKSELPRPPFTAA